MRWQLTAAALGLLLVGADGKKVETVKKETEALQGVWVNTGFSINGKEAGKGDERFNMTIKGDKRTIRKMDAFGRGDDGGEEVEQSIRIHADTDPKRFDIVVGVKDKKELVMPGIYELKNDTLKLCLAPLNGKRPTSFTSAKNDWRVYTFERKGDEEKK